MERFESPIIGQTEAGTPPPNRPGLGLAIAALAVTGILIALAVGGGGTNRARDPSSTEELSLPEASGENVRVPGLVGHDVDDVPGLLAQAGFDESAILDVRWIANLTEATGTVTVQNPPRDTLVRTEGTVSIEVSAGGPVLYFDSLPGYVQGLVDRDFDRSEPVLVAETALGPVYKTDGLLFGSCESVDLAPRLFRDAEYDVACASIESTTLTGWLPDGTAFAVQGLPPDTYEPTGISGAILADLPDGSSAALGTMSFGFTPTPAEPSAVRTVNLLTISAGFWRERIVLYEDVLSRLPADQADQLHDAVSPWLADGHLVVGLRPPLRFQEPREVTDVIAVWYDDIRVSRDCFSAPFVVCDASGQISVSLPEESQTEGVSITMIASGAWTRLEGLEYGIAYPDSWNIAEESLTPSLLSPAELVSLGTFPLRPGGELCAHVPEQALRDLGPEDVLISIQAEGLRERVKPHQFSDVSLARLDGLTDAHVCAERHDLDIRWQSFDIQGRGTRLLVAFGDAVSPDTKAAAWAILNSFEYTD